MLPLSLYEIIILPYVSLLIVQQRTKFNKVRLLQQKYREWETKIRYERIFIPDRRYSLYLLSSTSRSVLPS